MVAPFGRNRTGSDRSRAVARSGLKLAHPPLELGGDNVIANLWPEPADPRPGFHEKDFVENYLHRQVCSGAMSLADAQREIASDWLAVWRQIEGAGRANVNGPGE